MTKRDLSKAIGNLDIRKKNRDNPIPGILGFTLNGIHKVEVPTRPGFVYVRLRNSTNELIQAYNDEVSPVYDLPVLVGRDDVDKSRYKVMGRDLGVYQTWGGGSYLPRHGNQHSFNPDNGGGGDVSFIYSRQMMPLNVYPSGTSGAGMVMIYPSTYYQNNQWWFAGGTGTASIIAYNPTGSANAKMVLVYLDENANPQLTAGTEFSASITGTSAIIPYLPNVGDTRYIPLAGIRVVTGTTVIGWDNIYDLRPWIVGDGFIQTGTSTFAPTNAPYVTIGNSADLSAERSLVGGAGISITDNGANSTVVIAFTGTISTPSTPTYPAIYDDNTFKTTGTSLHFNNNLSVIVSGTSVWIDGASSPGGGSDILIYEENTFKATGTAIHFNNNLDVIVTGSSVWIDAVGVTGSAGTPGANGLPGDNTILIYDDNIFKVTGTAINFADNLNVVVSGSVAHISSIDTVGGGGGSNLLIYDDGIFKVTGTAIVFGNNIDVAVTGSVAFVSSSASGGRILISEETPTGTTVTWSSIVTTFKSFEIDGIARTDKAATTNSGAYLYFNNDTTAANYSRQTITSNGTTVNGGRADNSDVLSCPGAGASAGQAGQISIRIVNYASTTFNKIAQIRNDFRVSAASQFISIQALEWENTAAINRIDIVTDDSSNFVPGTTFRLYGVN